MIEYLPDRIVCVDDEQGIRVLVREYFENAGYTGMLASCSSGRELLDRFRVLQPDLILLDLRMPGMSGVDALEALRARPDGQDVKVIIVTAAEKVVMNEAYEHLGILGVIHKPFDGDQFFEQLYNILGVEEQQTQNTKN